MKKQINPTIKAYLIRSAFYFLLLLGVLAIPFALAQRQNGGKQKMAVSPMQQSSLPTSAGADHAKGVSIFKGFPFTAPGVSDNPRPITFTALPVHVFDLTRAGIMPIPLTMPWLRPAPDDGAMGTDIAYMAVTADVVPSNTTRAVGTAFSGFIPGETVNYYMNGMLIGTF